MVALWYKAYIISSPFLCLTLLALLGLSFLKSTYENINISYRILWCQEAALLDDFHSLELTVRLWLERKEKNLFHLFALCCFACVPCKTKIRREVWKRKTLPLCRSLHCCRCCKSSLFLVVASGKARAGQGIRKYLRSPIPSIRTKIVIWKYNTIPVHTFLPQIW